jgi:hypothetical protein
LDCLDCVAALQPRRVLCPAPCTFDHWVGLAPCACFSVLASSLCTAIATTKHLTGTDLPPTAATMAKAAVATVLQVLLLSTYCLLRRVECQSVTPYELLPSTPWGCSNIGGVFSWPAGGTGIFDEGSTMTISWNTTFPSVNIYQVWTSNISVCAPLLQQTQITSVYQEGCTSV